MKIAIFQCPSQPGDFDGNLRRLEAAAETAAEQGARLLVAPEMFLSGYNIGREMAFQLAQAVDGPAAERAAAIARETGVALLYGYPERDRDAVYNAAALIDRDGRRLANHRKSHLFGDLDQAMFAAGAGEPTLAELDGLRLGILICYDVEFPENVRLLALAGVDLIAVPTALMRPYEFIARGLVPARAYENQVFLAYANLCGSEGELDYHGLSCIVAPDGDDLARAGEDEALIVAELDEQRLAASRRANSYLRDRRPELYADLAKCIGHPAASVRGSE